MSITVNDVPSAGFTYQTAGLTAIMTNTSSNADTYSWDFGDGGLSSAQNPQHTYSAPGSYTVVLIATNACGSTTTTMMIEIQGTAPIASFSVENNMGCAPFMVMFTDQSEGDPTSWKWSFPGGSPALSTDQNPTVTYSTPGVYEVTLEVTNAYGTNAQTIPSLITVETVPVVGFNASVANATASFSNQSQNAVSYQWNFGDGSTSNEAEPTHTYSASGSYTVELTAINNCGASTLQQTIVIVISGVNDLGMFEQFQLYPNPNQGSFTVEMQGPAQNELEFNLYNAIGQLIRRDVADFGTGNLRKKLDYDQIAAGVYTLSIRSGLRQMVVKVVVQ
ncbi:MAG: PKD domain-containing protein [Lewinellaceae bacterium]|nr:PKD domain-containing protein [Lewinellaceae bacterium]